MGITREDLQVLAPYTGAFSIAPSDANDLPHKTRGIYVGGTGNLSVRMANGNEVTFIGLAAGEIHRLQVTRVLSSGTGATSIVGLY